jgi:1,2-diacylglycerol 3-beta-galactosyltransferase
MERSRRCRVLILFSDTGGGHRSAATAIEEALNLEYPGRVAVEMVDFLKQYGPFPFGRFPELYPSMVGRRRIWRAAFHCFDGRRRVALLTGPPWPYVRKAVRRLLVEHPADVIISVHPLANASVLRALRKGSHRDTDPDSPRFVIVVTDLGTTHAFWFHRRADLIVVPNPKAYRRGLACGIAPDRLCEVGLPIVRRFGRPEESRESIRRRLGWPLDLPIALLVGGGEGMGVEAVASAIDASGLPSALAIITGRNQPALERLGKRAWSGPTFFYGFIHEMSDFMHASDILVTKAGPNTVCEALNAALPMILYDYLPGQEEGNVALVEEGGAGVWAPEPEAIVSALRTWLEHPDALALARKSCRSLARPEAARDIARLIASRCILEL